MTNERRLLAVMLAVSALAAATAGPVRASQVDSGTIRLRTDAAGGVDPAPAEQVEVQAPRRGFDYQAFETRLESLWFQRKSLLSSGRYDEATEQLERIRSLAVEEGVKRLEHLAGALVAEAHRYYGEGNYERALSTLRFAAAFDADRPQIHLLRAAVHWRADRDVVAAGAQALAALRAAWMRSIRELTLFPRLAFLAGLSLLGAVAVFGALMLLRYQVALRHEVEELLTWRLEEPVARALAWSVVGLPLLLWVGAGWAALYWLAVVFRYMDRGERLATTLLLLLGTLTVPFYRATVAVFGTAADPAVRTTLLSLGGEYDPDRIVRLRRLVDSHPDDEVYHFLLAGMYKSGGFFDEAFREYKEALERNPSLAGAYVNIGNIFYVTGQFGEAIANYRRALEIEPESVLAYFNMHLAQSEDFRFSAADDSLRAARQVDPDRVASLLAGGSGFGDRPTAADASLELSWVWDAALSGRGRLDDDQHPELAAAVGGPGAFGTIALVALLALGAGAVLLLLGRPHDPARRCVRCGRPFCHRCKSSREAREYCSQCLHLFVLGDGLAPGTKSRKLYEVERQERRARRLRGLSSLVCPGANQLLRGRTGFGLLLAGAWIAALIAARPPGLELLARMLGVGLRSDLLVATDAVPAAFAADPLGLVAVLVLPWLWLGGNLWRWRRPREA